MTVNRLLGSADERKEVVSDLTKDDIKLTINTNIINKEPKRYAKDSSDSIIRDEDEYSNDFEQNSTLSPAGKGTGSAALSPILKEEKQSQGQSDKVPESKSLNNKTSEEVRVSFSDSLPNFDTNPTSLSRSLGASQVSLFQPYINRMNVSD